MRRPRRVTFALLVAAVVAFAALQSLVAPALPQLERELDTTPTGGTWILTSYLLSAAVLTPIAGRLGDTGSGGR